MPPVTPTVIARYQVRELLGSGTFGSVYRAFDPRLEREIALKVLRPEMTASSQAVERFLREARAAAKLHHAHIVPVHDAGNSGGVYYIASAFIKGRTLASVLAQGAVEPRRAVEWAAQLASALGYAHKQHVLHRDVKPANAMLDEDDALQLMDFGLAGWTQEESTRLTQTGAVMGTPAYMSPEQACGDTAHVGPKSDLYGAGVVLYQVLTGRLPFEAPHAAALVYRIVHAAVPPPSQLRPGLDPALETICLKAMARQPAERFATGEEMAAALRGWLTGGASPTHWSRATPPPVPPMARLLPESEIETVLPPWPRTDLPKTRPPALPEFVRQPPLRRGASAGMIFGLLAAVAVVLLLGAACVGGAFLLFLSPKTPSTAAVRPAPPAATTGSPKPPEPVPTDKDKPPSKDKDKSGAPDEPKPPVLPSKDKDKPADNGKPAAPLAEPKPAEAPFDADAAKQLQKAWADYLGLPVIQPTTLEGVKLTLIPAGTFQMGSPADEKGRFDDEGPQHAVEITRPFYLGLTTVTKGQFAAFAKDADYETEAEKAGDKLTWRNPGFDQTDDDPVVEVTATDAEAFCAWLSKKENKTYELPTEAEWEYACRAGTTTAYSFGDDAADLGDYAWFPDNSEGHTQPVAGKKPNPWGLYDMHGNAWQWCADGERAYEEGSFKDPKGPDDGRRCMRGGAWSYSPGVCRAAYRNRGDDLEYRNVNIGFRVVLRIPAKTP